MLCINHTGCCYLIWTLNVPCYCLLGLAGKDNKERARSEVVVDVLKEVLTELKPLNPFMLKETDESKIVRNLTFAYNRSDIIKCRPTFFSEELSTHPHSYLGPWQNRFSLF